jgi:hypothetical protein
MQPDLSSSAAEGLTTAITVDPGTLFRTVRGQGVTLGVGTETPPRVHVRS